MMGKTSRIVQATGKRKRAIARATIRKAGIPGEGKVRVNGTPMEQLTPDLARLKMQELFLIIADDRVKDYYIDVNVSGGGIMGQIDATRIAIARLLTGYFRKKSMEKVLREYDRTLLAGDPRQVEPKKFGGRKARKRFQKSFR